VARFTVSADRPIVVRWYVQAQRRCCCGWPPRGPA